MIKWIVDGKIHKMQEVRGGIQEVLSVRQIFNPTLFVMHNGILCYNRHTDPAKPYDALRVCVPAVKLEEVFKICHEGVAGGHRGVLEKVFIDLVLMSETVRKNLYLLTVQDGFTRFASAYPICNKEAGTVARVLIREHFSELKILHTKTPPYNPSSYIVEGWHRTIMSILRTMASEMQNEWDLGVKAACLAYNTTVHSSTGQTLFFATFGREAIVPIHWVYPIPKPDAEMDVSAWTETIQARFQTAYAGMREKQQATVCRNEQYYKPIMNQVNVGQWVWIFDPRIIPGSCDKLRSYWAGPYKIIRLLAPALTEGIAVFEQVKPRMNHERGHPQRIPQGEQCAWVPSDPPPRRRRDYRNS